MKKSLCRIATDEACRDNRDMPDICMQYMVAVMLLDKTVSFRSVHDKRACRIPRCFTNAPK